MSLEITVTLYFNSIAEEEVSQSVTSPAWKIVSQRAHGPWLSWVFQSTARSLEPSPAGAARLEPEPVCWATAQSCTLCTGKSGFCLLWKVCYFLEQKRDAGEAPSLWHIWYQNGEKKMNSSSRFTFYLVCAVFSHLIRDAYFNSDRHIILFMTDSFTVSILFVNLIPCNYLKQQFYHYAMCRHFLGPGFSCSWC